MCWIVYGIIVLYEHFTENRQKRDKRVETGFKIKYFTWHQGINYEIEEKGCELMV